MEIEQTEFRIPELEADFVFRRRPFAIPADLRPTWRIGLIVLLLKNCCRGGKSSLGRLHVLSWGSRTPENQRTLRAAAQDDLPLTSILVRFDPFLDRAVDFAFGEGIVTRGDGKSVELTPTGRQLAVDLESDESLYSKEKRFIGSVRRGITEELVNRIFYRR
jgi:hypothetical protein